MPTNPAPAASGSTNGNSDIARNLRNRPNINTRSAGNSGSAGDFRSNPAAPLERSSVAIPSASKTDDAAATNGAAGASIAASAASSQAAQTAVGGVSEGAAATMQGAAAVTQALQNGGVADAVTAGVSAARGVAGAWLVDFLWYSVLEIFPGALYGVPALTIYMVIGLFNSKPEWHQLAFWQIAAILFIDIMLLTVILALLIAMIYYYCESPLVGTFVKIGEFLHFLPQFCSTLK